VAIFKLWSKEEQNKKSTLPNLKFLIISLRFALLSSIPTIRRSCTEIWNHRTSSLLREVLSYWVTLESQEFFHILGPPQKLSLVPLTIYHLKLSRSMGTTSSLTSGPWVAPCTRWLRYSLHFTEIRWTCTPCARK
jgi:hypothetical protein